MDANHEILRVHMALQEGALRSEPIIVFIICVCIYPMDLFPDGQGVPNTHNNSEIVMPAQSWQSTYSGDKQEELNVFLCQFDHYVDMHNLDVVTTSTLIVSLHNAAARAAVICFLATLHLDDVKDSIRDRFDSLTTTMSALHKFAL